MAGLLLLLFGLPARVVLQLAALIPLLDYFVETCRSGDRNSGRERKEKMGGVTKYPYPRFVWSHSGGWWRDPPGGHNRPLLVAVTVVGAVAALLFDKSRSIEEWNRGGAYPRATAVSLPCGGEAQGHREGRTDAHFAPDGCCTWLFHYSPWRGTRTPTPHTAPNETARMVAL